MLTTWFDTYTRPHRVGVYQTRLWRHDPLPGFNYWNGLFWERTTDSPTRLVGDEFGPAARGQNLEWRGLTFALVVDRV